MAKVRPGIFRRQFNEICENQCFFFFEVKEGVERGAGVLGGTGGGGVVA